MRIFTGSYENCKLGDLVSISGDKGKSVGFEGNSYTKLAPKKEFWKIWHDNIGKISEEENNKYYMEEYYKQVLSKLDANTVYGELNEFGKNVVLLCFEQNNEFCHRQLVATWLERELGITVPEISIDKEANVQVLGRNLMYVEQFNKVIDELKPQIEEDIEI